MDFQKKTNPIRNAEEGILAILGKHLPLINKQYNTSLQLARFTDLKIIENMNTIIEAGLDKDTEDQSIVLFIDGAHQPTEQKLFEKFTYLFIKMLDPQVDHKSYTLVYFVGDEVMSSSFTRFREFMKLLPMKYYVRLKQMYVYHASLLVRSKIYFEHSKRGKLWKLRTQFIGDLNDLFTLTSFHKRWVELVPAYLRDEVDMTNLDQLRQESLALSPTKIILPIYGRELDHYDMNQLGIPLLLDHLMAYFANQPERLQHAGLFRKSGSEQEGKELAQLLSASRYDTLKMIDDVNIVADTMKKLLNSLTTPLISYALYNQVVQQMQVLEECQYLEFVQAIMEQMSIIHRRVLSVLLSFLLNVVEYEEANLMTSYNIAVVFTPCLMWSQNQSAMDIMNIGICIKFVTLMLKYYPTIFPNISYKLFLQSFEQSSSTSSLSSAGGIETQLQAQDEEEDTKEQFEDVFLHHMEQNYSVIEMSAISEELHMSTITSSPQQYLLQQHVEGEEDMEFTIESILTNAKHETPLRQTEKQNEIILKH